LRRVHELRQGISWAWLLSFSRKTAASNQGRFNIVTCGNRIDWYRWRGQDGKNVLCFANKGEANISKYNNVRYLCPGANRGQTRYYYGNQHYWSTLRGPVSNHNTCYSFGDYAVAAKGVRIS
ncbi:hypothetical protein, partial [Glutamicibacter sp. NPDC090743]|uniref:hypothetical protein n=1 Tax=Glutamicibacter sp. NPDC090743 TaxID=3364001 RepID=UPI00380E5435